MPKLKTLGKLSHLSFFQMLVSDSAMRSPISAIATKLPSPFFPGKRGSHDPLTELNRIFLTIFLKYDNGVV